MGLGPSSGTASLSGHMGYMGTKNPEAFLNLEGEFMSVTNSRSSKRRTIVRDDNARNQIARRNAGLHRCLSETLEPRRLLAGGTDVLVNNNTGASGTSFFTQSETAVLAYGSNVVISFNDSGSNAGGASGFTGFSTSTNGGTSFTDGGAASYAQRGGSLPGARQRHWPHLSCDTWLHKLHNSSFPLRYQRRELAKCGGRNTRRHLRRQGVDHGGQCRRHGQGNVYLLSRRFSGTQGIYFYSSTDAGSSFSTGTQLWTGGQGAYIAVAPDHSIYAFSLQGTSFQMRKSTNQGASFAAAVTIATGQGGGSNGDLALTGLRNGTATFSTIRSNGFPHAAINPVSGDIYVVYANNPAGVDKADVQLITSTNGGASFHATRVNDDATTTDQWQPTLAVTPNGSKLGIFYYSRQEDAANNNQFKYYSRIASISGATLTFAASEAVSDVASLPEFGRDSVVNTTYMGDYDMTAATNDAFHVVWSDSRSALPGGGTRMDPNVYYDKVVIPVGPNGIWTGLGDGVNWTDPANWSNNILPGPADDAVINIAANPTVILSSSAPIREEPDFRGEPHDQWRFADRRANLIDQRCVHTGRWNAQRRGHLHAEQCHQHLERRHDEWRWQHAHQHGCILEYHRRWFQRQHAPAHD